MVAAIAAATAPTPAAMHSVFRLPWSASDSAFEGKRGAFARAAHGVVEIPFVARLKRKRASTTSTVASLPASSPPPLPSPSTPTTVNVPDLDNAPPPPKKVKTTPAPAARRRDSNLSGPTGDFIDFFQPQLPLCQDEEVVSIHVDDLVDTQPGSDNLFHFKTPVSSSTLTDNVAAPEPQVDEERLRQTIEAQFDYEILLKHRELRLIEQELAKCRVAQEQLRRCRLIPFPASTSPDDAAVTDEVGTADQLPSSSSPQTHNVPPTTIDGPYARHYAHWLLPLPLPTLNQRPGRTSLISERPATRARNCEGSSRTTGKPRNVRTPGTNDSFAGDYLSPAQHPHLAVAARDRQHGPLTVRRSTDGRVVKLVCTDCQRSNFSSAQGFLNHCRIAHHRDYKSHDAAAIACGQELDAVDDSMPLATINTSGFHTNVGILPSLDKEQLVEQVQDPENPQSILFQPDVQAMLAPSSATLVTSATAIGASLVHPLVRSGPLPAFGTPAQSSSQAITPCHPSKKAAINAIAAPTDSSQSFFTSSSDTPRLSVLLRKRGFGGDLNAMVVQSKQRIVDLSTFQDEEALSSSSEAEGKFLPHSSHVESGALSAIASSCPSTPTPKESKGVHPSPVTGLARPQSAHRVRAAESDTQPNDVPAANKNRAKTRLATGSRRVYGTFRSRGSASASRMKPAPSTLPSRNIEEGGQCPRTGLMSATLSSSAASSANPGLVSDQGDSEESDDVDDNEVAIGNDDDKIIQLRLRPRLRSGDSRSGIVDRLLVRQDDDSDGVVRFGLASDVETKG